MRGICDRCGREKMLHFCPQDRHCNDCERQIGNCGELGDATPVELGRWRLVHWPGITKHHIARTYQAGVAYCGRNLGAGAVSRPLSEYRQVKVCHWCRKTWGTEHGRTVLV